MPVTFASLHDALTGAGLHVGIALDSRDRAAITIADPRSARSIRMPVRGGDFDAAALLLVASARLREELSLPDAGGRDWHVRGRWPELVGS